MSDLDSILNEITIVVRNVGKVSYRYTNSHEKLSSNQYIKIYLAYMLMYMLPNRRMRSLKKKRVKSANFITNALPPFGMTVTTVIRLKDSHTIHRNKSWVNLRT